MNNAAQVVNEYAARCRQQGRPLQLETIEAATGWTEPAIFRALQTVEPVVPKAGRSRLCRELPAHTPKALQAETITVDMETQLRALVDALE